MTVPENQWGYHKDWSLSYVKTPIEVIDRIVHAVSMGGNMVVNFGPQPDGDFRSEEKELAMALGCWMKRYGDATMPDGISRTGDTIPVRGKRYTWLYLIAPIRGFLK